MKKAVVQVVLGYTLVLVLCLSLTPSLQGFQSDELLVDDEEFGLEGGLASASASASASAAQAYQQQVFPDPNPSSSPTPSASSTSRRKFSDPDSDSKIQFALEHSFGDSEFSPAGTFSARLKTWSHGGQTLTKLRFSRNAFTEVEKEKFQKLLQGDDFYRIRLPSKVLSPPGKDYVVSSVKARCLPRDGLDEHFVIHMEAGNILAVNYGSPGACSYPRLMKLPAKWSFNSLTVLKSSEQAPRTPLFAEVTLGEDGEGEAVIPPERSFWAKYWMYLIPLGLIVMNAMTQAMNMPEEMAAGQPGAQSAAGMQRGAAPAVRRR